MRFLWGGVLTLLLGAVTVLADDDSQKKKEPDKAQTPAQAYKALMAEYNQQMSDFSKVYAQAKTDDERNKLYTEKYPPAKFAPRFMELAEKHPKDPAAVDAYIWVVQRASGSKEANQALAALTKDHLTDPKMRQVASSLIYSRSPDAEKLLRAMIDKNPDHEAKGIATYSLGRLLRQTGGEKASEAETLLEKVAKDFTDVRFGEETLADTAKHDLFEIRNLQIGKVAPEITGQDIDGKPFKLSDYKGKVVVLDFWGHW